MGCDWAGSVVEVDVGMYPFRGFGFSAAARGATSFPQSAMPDKRSEKDQQNADDDTNDNPSDRRRAQPMKRASGQTLNSTG